METGDLNASPECSSIIYVKYWRSVPEAMLTLFMAISGGIDWDDALVPLQEVSPVAVAALLLYIVITVSWRKNDSILRICTVYKCDNVTSKKCEFQDVTISAFIYVL